MQGNDGENVKNQVPFKQMVLGPRVKDIIFQYSKTIAWFITEVESVIGEQVALCGHVFVVCCSLAQIKILSYIQVGTILLC